MAFKSVIGLKSAQFLLKTLKPKVSYHIQLCNISSWSRLSLNSFNTKRFYSQQTDVEDELGLKTNPYFKKYSEKIKKLQKEDLEGFVSKVQELSEKKKPKAKSRFSKDIVDASVNLGNRAAGKISEKSSQPSYTQSKGLDSIVNVEKLMALPVTEIEKLWKEYHLKKDSLCAVIPLDLYDKMRQRALECPNFLYAVARQHGYEFIVGQFSGDNVYFTQLINYQAYKEDAPVCLTIHHFMELANEKGIVLMSGQFDSNILSVLESQFLANQIQMYYGTANLKRKLLLWTFNKEPHKFRHQDVIEQLEQSLTNHQ